MEPRYSEIIQIIAALLVAVTARALLRGAVESLVI
jgi:hypothetical protein